MKTNETRTDFRALCAELADSVELLLEMRSNDRPMQVTEDRLNRARAALAQPEPQGFTPDHVNLMCFAFEREPWATWLRRGGCLESAHCELSDLMLAVLARWGRPAIEPVPQGPSETAWALAQLLDGVQRHDLPNMTGLSDSDCDRIWAARPATTGEQQ
jgi:hypothetical protein